MPHQRKPPAVSRNVNGLEVLSGTSCFHTQFSRRMQRSGGERRVEKPRAPVPEVLRGLCRSPSGADPAACGNVGWALPTGRAGIDEAGWSALQSRIVAPSIVERKAGSLGRGGGGKPGGSSWGRRKVEAPMRFAPQTPLPAVRAGLVSEGLAAAIKMQSGHCPPEGQASTRQGVRPRRSQASRRLSAATSRAGCYGLATFRDNPPRKG